MDIVDHVTRGLSRLPSQFSDSTYLRRFLEIFLEELQEIEVAIIDIVNSLDLDTAVGYQLDVLGEHLGSKREGLSDTDYRKKLKIQKIINNSEGSYSEVYQLWTTLVETTDVTITEEFPAGIALYTGGGIPTVEQIKNLVQGLPITVVASLTASYDGTPAFCFNGGTGDGFGTTGDVSIGGKFISRYTSVF